MTITATMRATATTVLFMTTNDTEPSVFFSFFLSFFYAELKGQKLGDMQANSKNVAGITVSTTQCLYVVR